MNRPLKVATCAALLSFIANVAVAQSTSPTTSGSSNTGSGTAGQPAGGTKGAPSASGGGMQSMPMSGMQAGGGAGDMKAMMDKGMKEMHAMPMTGNTDHDFATMMRVHHQGAIDMAQMELQHGKDPKIRAMAKKIVDSQKKEIKEFDQWLAKNKR